MTNTSPYASVRSDAARALLDEHFDVGANLYAFWGSVPSVASAALLGWTRSAHPAQLHYAWDLDTAPSLDAGIEATTLRAYEALGVDALPAPRLFEPGCGIGGSVTQLARHRPSLDLTGMTLVEAQARLARDRAHAQRLGNARFVRGDYLAPPLADAVFDGIYAIETFVYTPPPEWPALLGAMHRLLRPGARLVILDGVSRRAPRTPAETRAIQQVLDGWTMPLPSTVEHILVCARHAGFEIERVEDRTRHVLASAARADVIARRVLRPLLALAGLPGFGRALARFGFGSLDHARRFVGACEGQRVVLESGVGGYRLFSLRRPPR
jgi:cyclopropane fatty-acyl-phospholipid synthase-like methyltransferase